MTPLGSIHSLNPHGRLGGLTNLQYPKIRSKLPVVHDTIYVSHERGNDSNSGLYPASAKKTIMAGIAAAPSGYKVKVDVGTYTLGTDPANEALIKISSDLTISGSWDTSYSSQSLESSRTILNFGTGVDADNALVVLDSGMPSTASFSKFYCGGAGGLQTILCKGDGIFNDNMVIRGSTNNNSSKIIKITGTSKATICNNILYTRAVGLADGHSYGIYSDSTTDDLLIYNNVLKCGENAIYGAGTTRQGMYVTNGKLYNNTINIAGLSSSEATCTGIFIVNTSGDPVEIKNNIIFGRASWYRMDSAIDTTGSGSDNTIIQNNCLCTFNNNHLRNKSGTLVDANTLNANCRNNVISDATNWDDGLGKGRGYYTPQATATGIDPILYFSIMYDATDPSYRYPEPSGAVPNNGTSIGDWSKEYKFISSNGFSAYAGASSCKHTVDGIDYIYMAGGRIGDRTVYRTTGETGWEPVGCLPYALFRGTMVSYRGKMYYMGGQIFGTSTDLATVYTSTDGFGIWTDESPVGKWSARSTHSACVMGTYPNDKIYLGFGHSSTETDYLQDLWAYDTVNGWVNVTPSGTKPSKRSLGKLSSIGTTLYMVGGYIPPTYTDEVWSWTPGATDWTTTTAIPTTLCYMSITTTGSVIYVAGGYDGSATTNKVYSFNGSSWTLLANPAEWAITYDSCLEYLGTDLVIFAGLLTGTWANTPSINNTWTQIMTWDGKSASPACISIGGVDLSAIFTTDKDNVIRTNWGMGAYDVSSSI